VYNIYKALILNTSMEKKINVDSGKDIKPSKEREESLRFTIIQLMVNVLKFFNLKVRRILPREALKFAKKYFNGKEITACEIGVYYGENTKQMNKHLNIKRFYLVDSYVLYGKYASLERKKNKPEVWKRKAHQLNKKGNEVWIEKFSDKAIEDIKEKLDFCYIDGNHTYEYVLNDLENYWKIMKKGGILSGHDMTIEDVSRAVIDFVKKHDLEVQFGDNINVDWWVIKKK